MGQGIGGTLKPSPEAHRQPAHRGEHDDFLCQRVKHSDLPIPRQWSYVDAPPPVMGAASQLMARRGNDAADGVVYEHPSGLVIV